jgi:hypothetical protein
LHIEVARHFTALRRISTCAQNNQLPPKSDETASGKSGTLNGHEKQHFLLDLPQLTTSQVQFS